MKKNPKNLRWGFSTGASMSALALCAWHFLQYKEDITQVPVYFLDDCERLVPVLSQEEMRSLDKKFLFSASHTRQEVFGQKDSYMVALYKDGGDDPDCTHNALLYARLSKATLKDATENDYILPINKASLIIKCVEGIGLCTREGLDCAQGKWAITHGPRQMLMENLARANMRDGVWCLEIGVHRGEILAKKTLNPLLGVVGGISLLGTTGLVRPYSHEAYLHTIEVCVKAHALSSCKIVRKANTLNSNFFFLRRIIPMGIIPPKPSYKQFFVHKVYKKLQGMRFPKGIIPFGGGLGRQSLPNSKTLHTQKLHMVFCTGGRTKKGAEEYLAHLPESAFTPIGDFIAESLKIACQYDMQSISVACMAGKLCKYAAGFTNTHAHKVEQDMDLLRTTLRQCLADENASFCASLENAPSVREALLFIPEEYRLPLLKELALKALSQFRTWCGERPKLQILVFDFDGTFLFEKSIDGDCNAKPHFDILEPHKNTQSQNRIDDRDHTNSKIMVRREYFLKNGKTKQEGKACM